MTGTDTPLTLTRFTRYRMECECGFVASAMLPEEAAASIRDHVWVIHKRNRITFSPPESREAGVKMPATGKEPN